jgi:hypothetical protein
MNGLGKRLRSGHMLINSISRRIEILGDAGVVIDFIEYDALDNQDWGYVYEKFVGQHLLEEGFDVTYNGLSKGFGDGGIDVIASRSDQTKYIQCKYSKRMGKARIEDLLWRASSWLCKASLGKNPVFSLAIPSIEGCFGKGDSKNGKRQPGIPLLAKYFLSKNETQRFIKVEILEIEMPK